MSNQPGHICQFCGRVFNQRAHACAHETNCTGIETERTRPAPQAHHYFTPADPELHLNHPNMKRVEYDKALPIPEAHRMEDW